MSAILVTGADGFLGFALSNTLELNEKDVIRVSRSCKKPGFVSIGDIATFEGWSGLLLGVDCVVHCAGRIAQEKQGATDRLSDFRLVNVQGTLNLARQAALAGVRRFIYISSIKVNGEVTNHGHVFSSDDFPMPADAYGESKAEAERALRGLSHDMGIEIVIIRPPMVYGPGVKGNFRNLLRCIARGLPLPLGSVVNNRRSMVALDNLIDLIVLCLEHPKAAGQTFLVSDGEDLSTVEWLRQMGVALKRPVRLFKVPVSLLYLAATIFGKKAVAQRLLGSLQVDITKTRNLLGWKPVVKINEGLRTVVELRL